jgi:predicted enzyme related to lactoylglutathione lyase
VIQNAIASVAVRELRAASEWYQRLFRLPPDSRPMPEVAEWKFPRGGWLQVYQLPERAGHCSCTLAVDDLDAVASHIESLGIDTSKRAAGENVNTLMITDPDGNSLAFAQSLDPTIAR